MKKAIIALSLYMVACMIAHSDDQRPDIILADFEGDTYGNWITTGRAFGDGPAQGKLPQQQDVEGFMGKGLANSYHGGDDATGTLTSPAFTIERNYISFLIGGGGFPGKTCINLLVDSSSGLASTDDNEVVTKTATGPNTQPGGSESLESSYWDVKDLLGKTARIQIVDAATGGWGHINVDQIVETDSQPHSMLSLERTLHINADFLQLPLMRRTDAAKGTKVLTITVDGEVKRAVHLLLAAKSQTPDSIYSYDIREFRDQDVILRFKSTNEDALNDLVLSNREVIDPDAYKGPNRPQFHFSPRIGWMNDVNGPYYQDGLYHLFYQYNPTTAAGSPGFDMHWGHSVSSDLVHWQEWPIALFPDHTGDCYSGTAFFINQNIPGINDSEKLPTPALIFTATASGQSLATSEDGGHTWKRYANNPVVTTANRDPKVFWYEPTQEYVMVVYANNPDGYQILNSMNLKDWEKVGFAPGWYECPNLFPLKSARDNKEIWVLYGNCRGMASAYQLGDFDGTTFTPDGEPRLAHKGPNFYAAQTFTNAPGGRQIMMGWGQGIDTPGEPFNQCASLPLELSLKAFDGRDTLCFEPVKEVNTLHGAPILSLKNISGADANTQLQNLDKSQPLDIQLRFHVPSDTPVKLSTRKIVMSYDPISHIIRREGQEVAIHPQESLDVRFLIDRAIVESFWNGGEAAYSIKSYHTDPGPAFSIEGDMAVDQLDVYPMQSIWNK
jgi:fructan beta-fructosidase